MSYVIGIDQSTQGTKVLLFDGDGKILYRADRSHRQIINDAGWVSHDMDEVYANLIDGVREVMEKTGVPADQIAAVGISNQRETTVAWDGDGRPLAKAIVWQCGRAAEITERLSREHPDAPERIRSISGLPLSPFFPAAKMSWLLQRESAVREKRGELHLGTVDSYLVYRLTGGKTFATDASNASRTQLFDLHTLSWSEELCDLFGVPMECLPTVCDSNERYGLTDFEGTLPLAVPILGVLGDSHAALFGQGCHRKGMMKTTFGTGSSMMLHAGDEFVESSHGLATSLAWGMNGKVSYVLEGNINYTGAVISWLKNDLGLIGSPSEVEPLIAQANPKDATVLVPAFTGLGAPYWDNEARAAFLYMSRTTKKPELVKAATESISHQIADVLEAMEQDFGQKITELRADGGPTRNRYLMQFTADMTDTRVAASTTEELSAIGAAYMAGLKAGCYRKEDIFQNIEYTSYRKQRSEEEISERRSRWKEAVSRVRG